MFLKGTTISILPSNLFILELPSQNCIKCGDWDAVVKAELGPHTNECSCEQRASSKPTTSQRSTGMHSSRQECKSRTCEEWPSCPGLSQQSHQLWNPSPWAIGSSSPDQVGQLWDLENPGQCDGLYQQWKQGCSLGSTYVQVWATGETGIQRQLLGRLCVWAQLLEDPPFAHTYIYSFSLVDFHPALPEQGSRMRPLVLSVLMWELWVSVCDPCGQPCIYTHVCI